VFIRGAQITRKFVGAPRRRGHRGPQHGLAHKIYPKFDPVDIREMAELIRWRWS